MVAEVLTEAIDVIIDICSQYSEATRFCVRPPWPSWLMRWSNRREIPSSNPGRDHKFLFPRVRVLTFR